MTLFCRAGWPLEGVPPLPLLQKRGWLVPPSAVKAKKEHQLGRLGGPNITHQIYHKILQMTYLAIIYHLTKKKSKYMYFGFKLKYFYVSQYRFILFKEDLCVIKMAKAI